MINHIEWTDIKEDGYPESCHDLCNQVCLIKKDGQIYPAIWCDDTKQWLNMDCRPFYSQWKVTHWAILNKPE